MSEKIRPEVSIYIGITRQQNKKWGEKARPLDTVKFPNKVRDSTTKNIRVSKFRAIRFQPPE